MRGIYKQASAGQMVGKIALRALLIVASYSLTLSDIAHAQDLREQRESAREELAPLFFNKFISIEALPVESSGPEKWKELFGKPLVGCPAQPFAASDSFKIEFTTSGAGAWAGSLDGINLNLASVSGFPGGGLAMSSNSTARASGAWTGPELSFLFDRTSNVSRAAVDRAAREVDECLSKLPPGEYPGDEVSRLCPYPEISGVDRKQTCVINTYGEITEPLPEGSGYKVIVRDQMMCDGVGYGRAQPDNTGWLSCYQNTYEGYAIVSAGQGGARISSLRAASKAALRKCTPKAGSRNNSRRRKIGVCAAKSIAQSMARTVR